MRRADDARFLTASARHPDGVRGRLRRAGALRRRIANARLGEIDRSAALIGPEGPAVLTSADLDRRISIRLAPLAGFLSAARPGELRRAARRS